MAMHVPIPVGDAMQELTHKTTLRGLPVDLLPPWTTALLARLPASLPWAAAAASWPTLVELWRRRSSDDLAFMLMLAINDCVTPVPATQVNMGDLQSLGCMVSKCRKQIVACVNDPQCKAALDGLSACGLNDQVRLTPPAPPLGATCPSRTAPAATRAMHGWSTLCVPFRNSGGSTLGHGVAAVVPLPPPRCRLPCTRGPQHMYHQRGTNCGGWC